MGRQLVRVGDTGWVVPGRSGPYLIAILCEVVSVPADGVGVVDERINICSEDLLSKEEAKELLASHASDLHNMGELASIDTDTTLELFREVREGYIQAKQIVKGLPALELPKLRHKAPYTEWFNYRMLVQSKISG